MSNNCYFIDSHSHTFYLIFHCFRYFIINIIVIIIIIFFLFSSFCVTGFNIKSKFDDEKNYYFYLHNVLFQINRQMKNILIPPYKIIFQLKT